MSGLWLVSYLALWVLVLFLGVLVFILFHELGVRVLHTAEATTRDGIALGEQAPLRQPLPVPAVGRLTLLVFGSPLCGPCRALIPDLNAFARKHRATVDAWFVSSETRDGVELTKKEFGLQVPAIGDRTAASEFKVRVTPFAFVLDDHGVVLAKGLVNHEAALKWVFDQARQTQAQSKVRPNLTIHPVDRT
jgi:thiol-disulfide isomerase/thioredoxin